jgi:hypothetical protein
MREKKSIFFTYILSLGAALESEGKRESAGNYAVQW